MPQKKFKKEPEKKPEKKSVKKIESEDDESDSDVKPKKEEKKSEKKPKEKPKEKKIESDDDESDSDAKPKKGEKKSEKKPPVKKEMEDSDSGSESEKKEKEKPKPKPKPKKEEKSEDEDEDEKEESNGGAKNTAKKEESSDNEEENEDKKDAKENDKDNDNEEELPSNVYEELFVRNIGYDTTEQGLAEYFAKYGDVELSKIVTDKNTGKSRGFGFLKFYDKSSAYKAMKDAENIVVDGRNLQIRYSNDKSSQMKGGNNSAKKGPASEFGVFVGNISYKCTENDLKKFFKDCGKVVDVRIAKKPDGKLKGFAHVDFETKEGMEKAVEKNGKELLGRALKIDQSSSGNGNKGGNKGQGRGRGRDNVDPMAKAKRTGAIVAQTENKVTTYDDSDDE